MHSCFLNFELGTQQISPIDLDICRYVSSEEYLPRTVQDQGRTPFFLSQYEKLRPLPRYLLNPGPSATASASAGGLRRR